VTSAIADVVVDPANAIAECNEAANTALVSAATVLGVANTPPTIQVPVTTTSYLSLPATGSGRLSGVLADPAATPELDFTIGDAETAVSALTVTAANSNPAVAPKVNLNLTGGGTNRNLEIIPAEVGYADLTVTVSDGTAPTSYVLRYARLGGLAPAGHHWRERRRDSARRRRRLYVGGRRREPGGCASTGATARKCLSPSSTTPRASRSPATPLTPCARSGSERCAPTLPQHFPPEDPGLRLEGASQSARMVSSTLSVRKSA